MYFILFLYGALGISVSFFCSIAEAVLLSITPAYTVELSKRNKSVSLLLEKLKENVDRPLAAILSLNTIAHTVGAAGVGATAAKIWGDQSVGVVSAIMTLAILIFSEVIPKTLGVTYWRSLAPMIGRLTRVLIYGMFPLVWICEKLTQLLSIDRKRIRVTRDEVAAAASLGAKDGQLAKDEWEILQNVLQLRNVQVQDIMTPRAVVFALPQNLTVHRVLKENSKLTFSRIPIYDEKLDRVSGFVLKDEILRAYARDEGTKTLADLQREIGKLDGEDDLLHVLSQLIKDKCHISIVHSDDGLTQGVVTMEDVLESLLGTEIVDESDEVVDMQRLAEELKNKI